jgi:RimJ/RimL family protein N-acetyltransferase
LPETQVSPRVYPMSVPLADREVTLRWMEPADRDLVLAFARSLPEADLLFLRNDITQVEVVDAWIADLRAGRTQTLLVESAGRLVGYGSVHHHESLWTRHIGELLMLVGSEQRGHGLGRQLARHLLQIAKGLELQKLWVQMMSNFHGAQTLFHRLGFIPEAMLHDWVIDGAGRTHNLLIMSREIDPEEDLFD